MNRRRHAALTARIEQERERAHIARFEAVEKVAAFERGINDLIDTHAPNVDAALYLSHMHPGWSDKAIPFYCTRCRVAWPCQTINDLRAIYGRATGWDEALIPYAPLVLRLADTKEPTT